MDTSELMLLAAATLIVGGMVIINLGLRRYKYRTLFVGGILIAFAGAEIILLPEFSSVSQPENLMHVNLTLSIFTSGCIGFLLVNRKQDRKQDRKQELKQSAKGTEL